MSFKELLKNSADNSLSGVKWHALRQSIVKSLLVQGDSTIAELSADLKSSIPTVTKAVNELVVDKLVEDLGKVANSGGRRPSLYSVVSSSAYLLGVEVMRSSVSIGLQDIKNEFVSFDLEIPFVLEDSYKSLDDLALQINSFLERSKVKKDKVLAACVSLAGRISSEKGTGYNRFFNEKKPFAEEISNRIKLPVYLENDTRAMTWGEYVQGNIGGEENVIFLNYGWGVSIGIIIKGKLFYGKSGYSGEFGHSPIFNNNKLCYCGKEGCLETEVSGWSLVQQFEDEIAKGRQSLISLEGREPFQLHKDILLGALIQEDSLCLDLITEQCDKMGRYLGMLINLLNPSLLIIGGDFAQLGDFALLPMQASIRKHSVSLVNKDMEIRKSTIGSRAGIIGACYVVKERLLGILN